MSGTIRRRDRENVPYLLSCGKRGKLERKAKGGVFCGDGEGDCVSALALW